MVAPPSSPTKVRQKNLRRRGSVERPPPQPQAPLRGDATERPRREGHLRNVEQLSRLQTTTQKAPATGTAHRVSRLSIQTAGNSWWGPQREDDHRVQILHLPPWRWLYSRLPFPLRPPTAQGCCVHRARARRFRAACMFVPALNASVSMSRNLRRRVLRRTETPADHQHATNINSNGHTSTHELRAEQCLL